MPNKLIPVTVGRDFRCDPRRLVQIQTDNSQYDIRSNAGKRLMTIQRQGTAGKPGPLPL